jgi:metallo-beta-lactamase family protein
MENEGKGCYPRCTHAHGQSHGADVLEVFHRFTEWHKLSMSECDQMCGAFKIIKNYKDTWAVIDNESPKIIIAGSGMMTGGRVLTYLNY